MSRRRALDMRRSGTILTLLTALAGVLAGFALSTMPADWAGADIIGDPLEALAEMRTALALGTAMLVGPEVCLYDASSPQEGRHERHQRHQRTHSPCERG